MKLTQSWIQPAVIDWLSVTGTAVEVSVPAAGRRAILTAASVLAGVSLASVNVKSDALKA